MNGSIRNREGRKGITEALAYLRDLASCDFFGTVELRFEAGNVVHLVEHRSFKPHSLAKPEKLESHDGTPFTCPTK